MEVGSISREIRGDILLPRRAARSPTIVVADFRRFWLEMSEGSRRDRGSIGSIGFETLDRATPSTHARVEMTREGGPGGWGC